MQLWVMVLVQEGYGRNRSELADKAERQWKQKRLEGRKTKKDI